MITHGIAAVKTQNKDDPDKLKSVLEKVINLKADLDAIEQAANSMNTMKAELEKSMAVKQKAVPDVQNA